MRESPKGILIDIALFLKLKKGVIIIKGKHTKS